MVCPYHKWAYNLDGELINAPGLEKIEKKELKNCGLNLKEIQVTEANNLIFINLYENNTTTLESYLGNYLEKIAKPHQTNKMMCVYDNNYTLKSNWKLYVEVDMETLHTPHIHGNSIGKQPVEIPTSSGQWVGVFNRSKENPALKLGQRDMGFPHTPGIYGEAVNGTHFCVILPGFFIVTAQDCMWWIQKTPISATEVEVNVGYCFSNEIIERDDFHEIYALYKDRWDQVIREDDMITEYQQKGLNNKVRGIYTEQEQVVRLLDQKIVEMVLADE